MLRWRGLILRDAESAWLSGDPAEAGALDDLIGHSITYRIAVGPRAGQKVFTLQTVPAQPEGEGRHGAAEASGFSLHAGLEIQPGERAKLERLCRYVSRPPADRGAGGKGAKQGAVAPAVPKHVAMSWAQRLKRVFAIEIENCARCQGRLRVIASIEQPELIARILAHREPRAAIAPSLITASYEDSLNPGCERARLALTLAARLVSRSR